MQTIRWEIERNLGVGPERVKQEMIPYTSAAVAVLDLAAEEANGLKHTCVGTEAIVLGLFREGEGVPARILKGLDVDLETLRREVSSHTDCSPD